MLNELGAPGVYMTNGSFCALSERTLESGRTSGLPSSADAKVAGAQGKKAVLGDEPTGGVRAPGREENRGRKTRRSRACMTALGSAEAKHHSLR